MLKKLGILLSMLSIGMLLTGCGQQAMISETGLDVSDLEQCIDDMVEENSNTACDASLRESLLEDYIRSFEDQFSTTDSMYSQTQLSYSQSKDGSIERIEFWFQYSLLPSGQAVDDYEVFKSMIETISMELREMNAVPEFIFSGEFLFMDDYAYKYHQDANDDLSGEIIVWGLLDTFANTYASNETFLLVHADDGDLVKQEYIIVTGDHSAKITIETVDNTYMHEVYFTADDAVTTSASVATIIENSFSTTTLTNTN